MATDFEEVIPVTGGLYTAHGTKEIEIKNGKFLILAGPDLDENISFDKKYLVNETTKGTGTVKNVTVTINLPNNFILNNDIIIFHDYFDLNTNIWHIDDLELIKLLS